MTSKNKTLRHTDTFRKENTNIMKSVALKRNAIRNFLNSRLDRHDIQLK